MTSKISAKIKGRERRKAVLVSRILYLLSDVTGVFFGKTTKNMDYPTPQSIKGCQRLIQFDNLLSKRWRVLMKNIKPIQKSLLGSKSKAARLISNPLLLLCILQDKMFQQQLISLGKCTFVRKASNNFSSVSGSSILDKEEKITRF